MIRQDKKHLDINNFYEWLYACKYPREIHKKNFSDLYIYKIIILLNTYVVGGEYLSLDDLTPKAIYFHHVYYQIQKLSGDSINGYKRRSRS